MTQPADDGGEPLPDMNFEGLTLEGPEAGDIRSQLAAAVSFGPAAPGGAPPSAAFHGGGPTKAFDPKSYADLCTLAHERFDPRNVAWKIRVQRVAPKDGRVAGVLGSFGDMSNEEFAHMFGGQKYLLTLLTIEQGITGAYSEKITQHSCEHVVPGAPKTLSVPDPHAPPGAPQGAYPYQAPPNRLDELRYTNEANLTNKLLERTLSQAGQGNEVALELMQQAMKQQALLLQGSVDTLTQQLRFKTEELEASARRIRELENDLRGQRLEHEGERSRLVKEATEEAERRSEARWSAEVKQLQFEAKTEREAAARQLTSERELMDKKIAMNLEQCRQDVERARNDADRQLEREKTDRAREVSALTSINETRITSLSRDNERDLKVTERMGDLVVQTKESLINKLESENARLTSEVERLKAQVFKPFTQQVEEIGAMAKVLGFEEPGAGNDDDDEPTAPAAPPPKSMAESLIAGLPGALDAASKSPALGMLLARFAGPPPAPPPPQQMQPPPQIRQLPGNHTPQPRPRQQAPVVGGGAPINVSPVVSPPPPRRQPVAPAAPPQAQPNQPAPVDPVMAPAHFEARGPQPDPPAAIEQLLTELTAAAKQMFSIGQSPEVLAGLLHQYDADRVAAYVAWVDADNALKLLERIEPSFWQAGDVREWFDSVWTLLGSGNIPVVEQAPAPEAPPPQDQNVSPPAPQAQASAGAPPEVLPAPAGEIIPLSG